MALVHRELQKRKEAQEKKFREARRKELEEKLRKEREGNLNEALFLAELKEYKSKGDHLLCERRILDLKSTLDDLMTQRELEIPIEVYSLRETRLIFKMCQYMIRHKIFLELDPDIQVWDIHDFQFKLRKNIELLEAFHGNRPFDDIKKYVNKKAREEKKKKEKYNEYVTQKDANKLLEYDTSHRLLWAKKEEK